eukprot:GDKJ01041401.1.p1 GENE.GDKJ01041401.1~~GDKJ01041401.1.p1  ORF type:complete len:216 (-),score=-1.49 GDKJ01041401.1:56-682(-)
MTLRRRNNHNDNEDLPLLLTEVLESDSTDYEPEKFKDARISMVHAYSGILGEFEVGSDPFISMPFLRDQRVLDDMLSLITAEYNSLEETKTEDIREMNTCSNKKDYFLLLQRQHGRNIGASVIGLLKFLRIHQDQGSKFLASDCFKKEIFSKMKKHHFQFVVTPKPLVSCILAALRTSDVDVVLGWLEGIHQSYYDHDGKMSMTQGRL